MALAGGARLQSIRASAFVPPRERRMRRAVLASSVAILCLGVLVRLLAAGIRDDVTQAPPVRPSAVPGLRAGVPRSPPPTALPPKERGGPLAVEIVARPAAPGAIPRPRPGPVDAAKILVSSPEGYERAVELFVGGLDGGDEGDEGE